MYTHMVEAGCVKLHWAERERGSVRGSRYCLRLDEERHCCDCRERDYFLMGKLRYEAFDGRCRAVEWG